MMSKRVKSNYMVAMLLLVTMLLGACSSKNDVETNTSRKNDSAYSDMGYYTIYSMENDEQEYARKDLKEAGLDAIYLWLDENGEGELFMIDEIYDLEWEDGRILDLGGEKASYRLDDDKLAFNIELNGEEHSFTFRFRDVEKPDDAGVVAARPSNTADQAGNDSGEDNAKTDTEKKPSAPSGKGSRDYIGTSGDLEDAFVEITGARYVVDGNGNDAMRLYIDYTNNSEETKTPSSDIQMEVKQGGVRLNSTYIQKDEYKAEEDNRDHVRIRPGVKTRYSRVYAYNPQGGQIEVSLSKGYGQNKKEIAFSMDPNSLGDEIPKPLETEPIPDPQWAKQLPKGAVMSTADGTRGYKLMFTKIETTVDYKGIPLVRVYYEVENTGSVVLSTSQLECDIIAFQDGFQLSFGSSSDRTNEERNVGMDIEPGEKITLAECFTLREGSESPVEVEMTTYSEGSLAGFSAGFNESSNT